jgi:hypothetical protein
LTLASSPVYSDTSLPVSSLPSVGIPLLAKKAAEHYVDNVKFLASLKEHREKVLRAKDRNRPAPRIPEYVGECFLKIATHLSYKGNFAGYSYREDMISDGVENCLIYANNFDPAKSSNPFGYFTQIIYFAFVRRIQREKKQSYIKYRMIEQSVINGDMSMDTPTDVGAAGRTMLQHDNVKDFIERFDTFMNKRRERRRRAKSAKV